MNSVKHIPLRFGINITVIFILTSMFISMMTENAVAEGSFIPFVRSLASNPSYPPSDIAWTGSQFIITTVNGGTLNTVSTQGKLSPFAENCFKIEGVESHIAIARLENYEFGVGNIYVSNGPLIWRIDPTGSRCTVFANLTSPLAPFLLPTYSHTQVTFDTQGSFGNNLLASTNDGSIWIINYKGDFKLLASHMGHIPECLDVAPTNFGPNSGKLIVGSQVASKIYAISKSGYISTMKFVLPLDDKGTSTFNLIGLDNEQCHFLPHHINRTDPISGMYITKFSQGPGGNKSSILKAPSVAFTPYAGSLILTDEHGVVSSILYNSTSNAYVIQGYPTDLEKPGEGSYNKWEGFVFVNNATQISN
jgi:hypothetical protein